MKDSLYVIMVFAAILIWGLGILAGVFLAYQPTVSGFAGGSGTLVYGSTSTEYVFSAKHAFGYWLLFFAAGFIVLQLAIFYNKCMLKFAVIKNIVKPKEDE